MKYSVMAPPGDEVLLTEQGIEICKAAKELGLNLDAEGFLMAWVGASIRVIVQRDEQKAIVGVLLMACGKRWLFNDFTATVLEAKGTDVAGLVDYAINIAAALGATKMYSPYPVAGAAEHTVYEARLQ